MQGSFIFEIKLQQYILYQNLTIFSATYFDPLLEWECAFVYHD